MAQQTTSRTPENGKIQGDTLSAIEFNECVNVVYNNASDLDTWMNLWDNNEIELGDLTFSYMNVNSVDQISQETFQSDYNNNSSATLPFSIRRYPTHDLPDVRQIALDLGAVFTDLGLTENAFDGNLAFDTAANELVYYKNGRWHKVSDNSSVFIANGLSFKINTANTDIGSVQYGYTTSDTQFALPLTPNGVYEFTIDWNCDNPGTDTETISSDPVTGNYTGELVHDYGTPGEYIISISGVVEGFQTHYDGHGGTANNQDSRDALKMIELLKFGDLVYNRVDGDNTDARTAFLKCQNLQITAADAPDTSQSTNFLWMFYQNYVGTQFPYLDMSSATEFWAMFRDCRAVEYLPNYNFSANTGTANKFKEMFRSAHSLISLENCQFGNATANVEFIFDSCLSLTSIPSSLNFTNSTRFRRAFYNCTSLTTFSLTHANQMKSGQDFRQTWESCALDAQSIEYILSALTDIPFSQLLYTQCNFTGGTNTPYANWTDNAKNYHTSLTEAGWSIATN